MVELFSNVLNMSMKASYIICAVIIIRFLLKKSSKIISYVLWSVAGFRLMIPISFESALSLLPKTFNNMTVPNEIIYKHTPQINVGMEITAGFVSKIPATSPIMGGDVNSFHLWFRIGVYIWIIGIMVLIIYSLMSIILLKKQLRNAKIIKENIFEVRNLKTPFVLGLIKPKIYLPHGINEEERYYILLHEQIHIKRKDHIVKVLAFFILTIHWFNPLVWIAFILMGKDMEFSCDERVLKEIKEDIKKSYAATLLALSSKRFIINGSPLAFGEGDTKVRIKNVLNYKRPRFWVMMFTVILVGGLAIGLMSNPKYNESFENPTQPNTNIDANMDNNSNGLEDKVPEEIIDLDNIDNVIKDVSMTIKENTLSTSKATIIFTNKTEKETTFGEYFHLEKKTDGEWKKLPTIIENYAFDDIAYPLNEKESRELVVDWEWLYGALNEGEYRIVKDVDVSDFSSTADYDKYFLYAEFNINKEVDFNKLGLNIQLPESENWIYNPVYKIVDGKIAQVEYFDKIAENTEQAVEMKFTEDEVKDAYAVVEEYFRATQEKDAEAFLKTWTPEHNTANVLYGDEIRTLNSINYSKNDPMRKLYVENGRGSINNTPINNVIVFRVNFNKLDIVLQGYG